MELIALSFVDCYPAIDPFNLIVSILLVFGIVISYTPQIIKIVKSKSSEGFSPWYLMLGALASISNLLNIIILQSETLKCCSKVDAFQCFYNLLGFLQLFSQVSMFAVVTILFYIYFPLAPAVHRGNELQKWANDWRSSNRAREIILYYFIITTVFTAMFLLISPSVEHEMIKAWTIILAAVAVSCSMIQFIPQIVRTYQLNRVGALSISAMSMQTPGSFLLCYTISNSPGTNITTWITYFVGGVLQGILLCLCLYFHLLQTSEFVIVQEESAGSLEFENSSLDAIIKA